MANNVYINQAGLMYAAATPTSANDSMLNNPSAFLLASLTSTPEAIPVADAAVDLLVDESGAGNNGDDGSDG